METALIVILAICLISVIIWFILREFKWRSTKLDLKQEIAEHINEIERQKEEMGRLVTTEDAKRLKDEALKQQLTSTKGIVWQQLAPLFPEFCSKYEPADCKFIGKPIDFIIFQGLSKQDPQKIIFVEVKTGEADVIGIETKIKKLVLSIKSQSDKVDWDFVRLKTTTEEGKV